MEERGNIVFYESEGISQIEVKLENETVWLTQDQMAGLFQKAKSTINEHISNIYDENELDIEETRNKFGNPEFIKSTSKKPVYHYSLDVIISVGYRVKSVRGTQFRIWANKVLKSYLTKGYAIDHDRFQHQSRQLEELRHTVKLLGNVIESKALNTEEATGLLKVITDYTVVSLVMRRINLFRGRWRPSIRHLAVRIFIQVWRRRRLTCCILLLRTIRSLMGINVSPRLSLCGSWKRMASCTGLMDRRRSRTMRWWP